MNELINHDEQNMNVLELAEPQKQTKWKSTSDTPIPRVSSWYIENELKIERLMHNMNLDRKGVHHEILLKLGRIYNLEIAKEIYKKENGFEPPYAMNMVEYFTDLQEDANNIIDKLLEQCTDPKPFGWDW